MSKLPHEGVDYADLSHLIPVGMLRLDFASSQSSRDKKANTFNKALCPWFVDSDVFKHYCFSQSLDSTWLIFKIPFLNIFHK